MDDKHEVLTITEAADFLRISVPFAYRAAKSGQIPTIKLGDRVLVPKAGLQAMLAGSGEK